MAANFARDFIEYGINTPGHSQFAVGTVDGSPCYQELPHILGPKSQNRMVVIGLWHSAGWLVGMLPVTEQLVIITPFGDEAYPNQLFVSSEGPQWQLAMQEACRELMLLVNSHLRAMQACHLRTNEMLFDWVGRGKTYAVDSHLQTLESLQAASTAAEQYVVNRLKRMLSEQTDHFTLLSYVPEEDAS